MLRENPELRPAHANQIPTVQANDPKTVDACSSIILICKEVFTSRLALWEWSQGASGDCTSASMQVYGYTPRWMKFAKQLTGRQPEAKFDEVVEQLSALTQQIWALQEGPGARESSRCT